MAIPDTKESLQDGNLALAGEDSDEIVAFIGACSAGTVGTFYSFTSPDDVAATLGTGPAVEAMAAILEASGGTAYFSKPATTPEAAPTVTQPASGTSPVVGATGNPLDAYEFRLKITGAGTLGASTFQLSTDGGDTFSADIAVAATYAAPGTGVTFTFAAGTYVVDDRYTATTKGPSFSLAQFNAALDVLVGDPRDWSLLHAVGVPDGGDNAAKSAAAAAMAANLQAKLDAAFNNHLYLRAVMDGPDVSNDAAGDSALIAATVNSIASRVVLVADFAEVRSPVSSNIYRRPAAWPFVARVKRAPISEDAAYVLEGKLMASVLSIRRDEARRPGLNAQRIATLRTFRRKPGFYVTKPKTLAPPGSDYELLQHGRIMDKACRTVRDVMLPKLNGKLRTNLDGTIHEVDARVIEQDLETALKRDIVSPGHAVSVKAVIVRTDNILSSKRLRVKVSVLPYAYPEQIEELLGFQALVTQAA